CRRAERPAADDDDERYAHRHSQRTGVRRHHAVDSRDDHAGGRRSHERPGPPRDDGVRRAGWPEQQGRLLVDGLNTGASRNGGGVSGYNVDITNAQEVYFTTSGGLGEAEVGGPSIQVVPKTGGNTVKGSAYLSGFTPGMVGSNYTPELQAAGLSSPSKYIKAWDYTAGGG